MPFTLTMPKLSPTMEAGTIVKWHKNEGDQVKSGDLLFEVATDKATVEYEALDGGFLRQILVTERQEATVNQPVAVFTETAEESLDGYQPEGSKPTERATAQETVSNQSDAPTVTASTPKESAGAKPVPAVTFKPEPPLEDYTFEFATGFDAYQFASPLAKRLAKEKGIDLSTVKGSGPDGRIMSRDLDLGQKDTVASFGQTALPQEAPGSYVAEPLTPIRKAIGERLQASKMSIPHFYVQQDIAVEPMITAREELKGHGIKVTFNDFILRAAALALKEHCVINSGFDAANNAIIRFKTIDIAVAVSIPDGLITPIIRHADYKNLGQISVEVKQLATLAKEGKLQPHQYRGGSFTVSNLGMFGIHDFQAVINPPQAAILAVGGIRECPVAKEGKIVVGKRMMLSLSSDHRVVDGADAARFLIAMQQLLEAPAVLLIS
ncbi:MAG: dihydrolipoamide acetyltransferase family protein [Chlamydiota bacterium]